MFYWKCFQTEIISVFKTVLVIKMKEDQRERTGTRVYSGNI